jgi:hypothetical protein
VGGAWSLRWSITGKNWKERKKIYVEEETERGAWKERERGWEDGALCRDR